MENVPIEQESKKNLFQEKDYIPFMFGVFVLGGIFGLPFLWGSVFGLNRVDPDNYYFGVLMPSFLLCLSLLIAFKRDGSISKIRVIISFLIVFLVSAILSAANGGSFMSGTLIGIAVLVICGHVSVWARGKFSQKR